MQAVLSQLQNNLEHFGVAHGSIQSLFIGGGTPSTIAPQLYEPLFKILRPYLSATAECTVEANPNSATLSWLAGMQQLGINRVSFGVQSFDNEKLKNLGRSHNRNDAVDAISNASIAGFEHISLDLIYASVFDTPLLLEEDIKQASSLPVDHLSAYALTIEEGTVFQYHPEVASEKLEETRRLFKMIEHHGFKQYEISNFGTYTSRHNLGYWQYRPYLGIGAGAVGCINNTRYYPHRNIDAYIQAPCFSNTEVLLEHEIKRERIFLGLRSVVGVADALLNTAEKQRARLLVDEEKLTLRQGTFYNTDYLLSDEIALFIED